MKKKKKTDRVIFLGYVCMGLLAVIAVMNIFYIISNPIPSLLTLCVVLPLSFLLILEMINFRRGKLTLFDRLNKQKISLTEAVNKNTALFEEFATEVGRTDPTKPASDRILEYFRDELTHSADIQKYFLEEMEKLESQGKNPVKEMKDPNTEIGKALRELAKRSDQNIVYIEKYEKEYIHV